MARKRNPIDQIEFMRNLLAFNLVASFVGAIVAFTFYAIPDGNKDIITYMVGQLSGMATMALGFYYVGKVGQDALDATRAVNTSKMADAVNEALKQGHLPEGTAQDPLVIEGAENMVPVETRGEEK